MKLAAFLAVALVACAARAPTPAAPACPDAGAGTLAMRSYFLVLLRRGPAWTPEKTDETKRIFEGHMANIEAMARTGALVLAGPTGPADGSESADPHALAGIFVFGVATRAEVEALMANDPAIAIGRLVPEILEWYGPAGLTYPGQRDLVVPP
jgi:uncharacterized protein YciI